MRRQRRALPRFRHVSAAALLAATLLLRHLALAHAKVSVFYSLPDEDPEAEEESAGGGEGDEDDNKAGAGASPEGAMSKARRDFLNAFPALGAKLTPKPEEQEPPGGGALSEELASPLQLDELGSDAQAPGADELDPGGWRHVAERPLSDAARAAAQEGRDPGALYALGIKSMLGAPGVARNVSAAVQCLQRAAATGHAHAQSALAFLHGSGCGLEPSDARAFLYHSFAAAGGSYQSKMALAYSYMRQQEYELAADLYAEVAAKAVSVYRMPGAAPLVETVRLYTGAEESAEAVRGHRGEDDETLQYLEYNARNGNVNALRLLANFYFWGARGLPRDHARAFEFFQLCAEQGDAGCMANLGEMYSRGVGAPQSFEQALKWFRAAAAADKDLAAAHNGLGYQYAKGRGVPRNFTKALECFGKAARSQDPDGQYNMGVLNLHGLGVKANTAKALRYFELAHRHSHLGAVYQLAKASHKGLGTPKDAQAV